MGGGWWEREWGEGSGRREKREEVREGRRERKRLIVYGVDGCNVEVSE